MKITVGARFQLKLTVSNFAQKGISDGKWKKVSITIEFCIFKLTQVLKFQIKLTVLIFGINLLKKGIFGLKQKSRSFASHSRYLLYQIFCKGAGRHNIVLMSLLLLATETMEVLHSLKHRFLPTLFANVFVLSCFTNNCAQPYRDHRKR